MVWYGMVYSILASTLAYAYAYAYPQTTDRSLSSVAYCRVHQTDLRSDRHREGNTPTGDDGSLTILSIFIRWGFEWRMEWIRLRANGYGVRDFNIEPRA